jgi:hypothetical protein
MLFLTSHLPDDLSVREQQQVLQVMTSSTGAEQQHQTPSVMMLSDENNITA